MFSHELQSSSLLQKLDQSVIFLWSAIYKAIISVQMVNSFPPKPSAPPSPTSLEKGRRNSKAWQGRSEREGGGVLRSLRHVGSSLVPNPQAGKPNHKTKMEISGNVILNVASSLVYVQSVRPGDDLGSVVGLFWVLLLSGLFSVTAPLLQSESRFSWGAITIIMSRLIFN